MTVQVRNYLLQEREEMVRLDESAIFQKTLYSESLTGLEQLGLESVMRLAVAKGLETFTNFDELSETLFPSSEEEPFSGT